MWKVSKKIHSSLQTLTLLSASIMLYACNSPVQPGAVESTRRTDANVYAGTNRGLIYPDNLVELTGNYTTGTNFSGYLEAEFITDNPFLESTCSFTQNRLVSLSPPMFSPNKVSTTNNCLQVLNDENATTTLVPSNNESWLFDQGTDEFYQVNTFYHSKKILDRFLESMSFTHKYVHLESSMTLPPATKYNFDDTNSFFLLKDTVTKTLKSYSKCVEQYNAFFSPAEDKICYGYDNKSFRVVQDPSLIYHEMGHALVKIMMNQRNMTSGFNPSNSQFIFEQHPFESDLGEIFYDEAGAINEAIADYFSYYMNRRSRVAEYFFYKLKTEFEDPIEGPFIPKNRPMAESEEEHGIDLAETTGSRLSYPQHVHYDPANPTTPIEDVHYSSGTISHYLVALTKEFKNRCSFTQNDEDYKHKMATNFVMLLISETLGEIGDLTAKGSDFFSEAVSLNTLGNNQNLFFTNLNDQQSFLWTQVVNPPNFRRFFRIFGKNIIHYISDRDNGLCPSFSKDSSERLLDDYGLLLFKSYEDKGNGVDSGLNTAKFDALNGQSLFFGKNLNANFFNTQVEESNRKQSILISKDFLELDTEAVAFVVDGQNDMKNLLANLTFEGENISTTQGIAGTEYNNNNIKISPGEVVAVSLNIFNNSNSIMGGVQFLANDWDHMKLNDSNSRYINKMSNKSGLAAGDIFGGIASHSPCAVDGFPSASEGGVNDVLTSTPGSCAYTSRDNKSLDKSEIVASNAYPKYELDSPQPICMVQYSDENETKWVSQDFYRTYAIGLEDSACLNNPSMSGNDFNPNECLMRFLPGASQAVLGKINPQSTWAETIQENQDSFKFDAGHLTIMEVNKWIEPGTKFNCRFRVRFSNCSDCFDNFTPSDSAASKNEFSDYDYIGHEPYKVINLQFTVLD